MINIEISIIHTHVSLYACKWLHSLLDSYLTSLIDSFKPALSKLFVPPLTGKCEVYTKLCKGSKVL